MLVWFWFCSYGGPAGSCCSGSVRTEVQWAHAGLVLVLFVRRSSGLMLFWFCSYRGPVGSCCSGSVRTEVQRAHGALALVLFSHGSVRCSLPQVWSSTPLRSSRRRSRRFLARWRRTRGWRETSSSPNSTPSTTRGTGTWASTSRWGRGGPSEHPCPAKMLNPDLWSRVRTARFPGMKLVLSLHLITH